MKNLTLKLTFEESEKGIDAPQGTAMKVHFLESEEQDIYVFFRGHLFAQY